MRADCISEGVSPKARKGAVDVAKTKAVRAFDPASAPELGDNLTAPAAGLGGECFVDKEDLLAGLPCFP